MKVQMKLKIIAAVVIGLIVVPILYLYITRNSAVIYRSGDRGSGQNSFVIQNPFRERGPEDEAEKVLQDLKGGNCERALAATGLGAEAVASTCEREGLYPIQSWSLVDRSDIGKQAILVYSVYRGDRGGGNSETSPRLAWIDVERVGEDRFRVLSYQTY